MKQRNDPIAEKLMRERWRRVKLVRSQLIGLRGEDEMHEFHLEDSPHYAVLPIHRKTRRFDFTEGPGIHGKVYASFTREAAGIPLEPKLPETKP